MLSLTTILNLLLVVTFGLFFAIIGVNKKTIDNMNNQSELIDNIETLRGVIWANFTFMLISIAVVLTYIFTKQVFYKYKMTVMFGLFFGIALIGVTIYEEIILRNYETNNKKQYENIYIISSIVNVVFFILFVRMIKYVNENETDRKITLENSMEYKMRYMPQNTRVAYGVEGGFPDEQEYAPIQTRQTIQQDYHPQEEEDLGEFGGLGPHIKYNDLHASIYGRDTKVGMFHRNESDEYNNEPAFRRYY